MNKGSLIYEDYIFLKEDKQIIFNNSLYKNQIQPASIDLTISEECYQISSSFLSSNQKVKDKVKNFIIKKINLEEGYTIKKDKIYLIKLNEKIKLQKNLFGKCNPKSSTGRLDIFCRSILDYSDEYEKVPYGYNGDIFLEVTTRAFDIFLTKGDSLNQMRLTNISNDFIKDEDLRKFHNNEPIIFNKNSYLLEPNISSGLKISVDLSSKDQIIAYKAKNKSPKLIFSKKHIHDPKKYWEFIKKDDGNLTIFPNEFFILKSKQKIRIPKTMAAEMVPYDTSIGDFRVHYAGFFDPGFGDKKGSYAVLEVKTHEVPFNIEDGQYIARLIFENLNKTTDFTYGGKINSNYQNQELALSKHFNIIGK